MKKCLFLIGSVFLFSCSFSSFEVKEVSDTIKENERGVISSNIAELVNKTKSGSTVKEYFKINNPQKENLYMIKFNNSKNEYSWDKTGYIESSASRNAGFEEYGINENLYTSDVFKSNENYIDKLNRETQKKLISDSSRASSKTRKIQQKNASKGSQKKMYILCKNDTMKQRTATCKYVGKNCAIWFIDNANVKLSFSSDDYKKLADKFDLICDLEEEYFGKHAFTKSEYSNIINPYDKIDIILADIEEDSSENQNLFTCGYFYNGDLITNISDSNQTQAIYLDSYLYKKDPKNIYSTIVHEYGHLLNYVQKTILNKASMNTWYTEMLAMLAEDMFQDIIGIEDSASPKSRLEDFILYHSAGFGNWKGSLVDYANAYFFGAYLARNYGGPELVAEIAKNAYADEKSITKALKVFYTDGKKDFNYVLQNEPYILFSGSSYTLNKTVKSKNNDGICLKGFDVFKTYKQSKIDKNSWKWLFSSNYISSFNSTSRKLGITDIMKLSGKKDDQFGLGSYGFSVRNIGYNLKEFTVTSYNSNGINYYFSF